MGVAGRRAGRQVGEVGVVGAGGGRAAGRAGRQQGGQGSRSRGEGGGSRMRCAACRPACPLPTPVSHTVYTIARASKQKRQEGRAGAEQDEAHEQERYTQKGRRMGRAGAGAIKQQRR